MRKYSRTIGLLIVSVCPSFAHADIPLPPTRPDWKRPPPPMPPPLPDIYLIIVILLLVIIGLVIHWRTRVQQRNVSESGE